MAIKIDYEIIRIKIASLESKGATKESILGS